MSIKSEIERINKNNLEAFPLHVRERAERESEIREICQQLRTKIFNERRGRSGKSPTFKKLISLVLKHQDVATDKWIDFVMTDAVNMLSNLVFEEGEVRVFLDSEKAEDIHKNQRDN